MSIKPKDYKLLPVSAALPRALDLWINYQDSLTELLKIKAGDTRLDVFGQRWGLADWWDQHVLQLTNESVLHREILMWANEEPCWYARTIIPKTTYLADEVFFNRLQKESLGALIFNERKIKRIQKTSYPVNSQSIEYHWVTACIPCSSKTLWTRLSVFTLNDDYPFYLIEVLLPALERYS